MIRTGSVFFVAFDLFDAFEDMGIREPAQVLEATISLHVPAVRNRRCAGPSSTGVSCSRGKRVEGTSTRAEDNETHL